MQDDLLQQVSASDKDRYLSLLYAPAGVRFQLAALYAFNSQLDKVRHQVTEHQIGAIRLQWWREALERAIAGDPVDHPLVKDLALAVAQAGVPVEGLHALIDAHETMLFQEQPATLEDLERHLGQSSSMLMQLAIMILGGSAPETAGLAGVAYGLARLLHGSPRWFVPRQMQDELGNEVALNTLVAHARRRLFEARKTQFENGLLPALLPAATVPHYLRAVEARPDAPRPVSTLRRQAAIWWAARKNAF